MGATATPQSVSSTRFITYLTPPMPVNMGDWWFDIATSDHFWIKRRFEVLTRLAGSAFANCKSAAEIGCGNGLLQKEVEDRYGIEVAGFDLNELALQKNVSRSPLYCYDIHQRNLTFKSRFELLLMFDVLEHIDLESDFLQAAKFHLKPSGKLLINVPAHSFFYSDYDRAAGHVRRYTADQLTKVATDNGLKVTAITYWGLPLVPLLLIRKAIPMKKNNGKTGFDTRSSAINKALSALAKCEPLPQKFLGTSLMAVLEKRWEEFDSQ